MNLSKNIYELRKERGLTQEELAESIKVSRQTISNWELGETQPNPDQLVLLSKTLNISVDDLLNNSYKSTNRVNNNGTNNNVLYILIGLLIIALVVVLILFFREKDKNMVYLTTTRVTTVSAYTSNPYDKKIIKSTTYVEKDTFIRTYKVEDIEKVVCDPEMDGCDDTTYKVVLSKCGKEKTELQLTNSSYFKGLKKGKTYEFKFYPMLGEVAFEEPDAIRTSFAFATVVEVTETNKKCADQRQDKIKTRSN